MSKRGQVIALVTSKGGSGKTTLAVSIAAELLARGEVEVVPFGIEDRVARIVEGGGHLVALAVLRVVEHHHAVLGRQR